MEFPTLLYKVPGPHRPGYDYIACADDEQFRELSEQGWCVSQVEAMGAKTVIDKASELEDAIDEISPATRDEMEAKAKELKVGFNSRTPDDVLAKRIAEAL